MPLFFDQRDMLNGRPGLHALIVGISSYQHLPGGSGRTTQYGFGLGQLGSAAVSAYKFATWLKIYRETLPIPLASCRLLIAPSVAEVHAEPDLQPLASSCTLPEFLAAAADWRDDAAGNKQNITLFYFAGHGFRTNLANALLLLSDYGDGRGDIRRNCIDVMYLYQGMKSFREYPNLARQQLYFIDACGSEPDRLRTFYGLRGTATFPIENDVRDNRHAPIFFAAAPGSNAYGVTGEQTLFSRALLRCLDGGAGDYRRVGSMDRWCVSVHSLSVGLEHYLTALSSPYGLRQEPVLQQGSTDFIIRLLPDPPTVDVSVHLEPQELWPSAELTVFDGNTVGKWDDPFWHVPPPPIVSCPLRRRMLGGTYRFSANARGAQQPVTTPWLLIRPPAWECTLQLQPAARPVR